MKNKWMSIMLAGMMMGGACAFSSCAEDDGQIHVYAPDGAPALALAKLLADDTEKDGIEYTITSANKIVSFVDGDDPQADVCILPINQASTKIGDGSMYQMVGLATHGNLYLLSEDDTQYTRENISLLEGKTIGVMQLHNVPGLALRATLADLLGEQTLASIRLQGVSQVTEVGATKADVYLVPEPAATTRIKQLKANGVDLYRVGDLQALYGGDKGFPQAAVVAKKSFIEENPGKFQVIIDGLTAGETYLQSASISFVCDSVSAHLEDGLKASLTVGNLTSEVIARSNVRFEKSASCYLRVDDFLRKLSQIDGDKARPVAAEFYYFGD